MKLLKKLLWISVSLLVVVFISYLVLDYIQEGKPLDDQARQDAPGQFVKLSDGITHYQELGPAEGTPVLLIHGGGITGMEVWQQNAPVLAGEGYRVLLYDLYGRGYSDRLATAYTPELLNRQLTELIEAIHFPDTFHIISMSLGSIVALDYAAQHHTLSLTLIDPAITGDYRPNRLLKLPVVSSLLMTFYWCPKAVENQRKEFVDQDLFNTYANRLTHFMQFKGYKHVNYSTWMNTLMQNKLELLAQMPAHKTMLIYGANDPYFPESNPPLFLKACPTLQIAPVEQAGHMPHFEKPDVVNPLVLDFLKHTNAQPATEMPE